MMAFFLLMWLLNATTEEQKSFISEYFSPSTISNTTGGSGGLLGAAAVSAPGAMTSRTAQPSVSLELLPTSGAQDGEADVEGGGAV
jgi:chemotaxis protein MotB